MDDITLPLVVSIVPPLFAGFLVAIKEIKENITDQILLFLIGGLAMAVVVTFANGCTL